ncbi:MAG: Fur family transcriptional regulator [Candidatus Methylacidiphilales bacterium]
MSEAKREIREKILAYMESNGMRITSQRKSIIEAAFSTTEHYTAEELLERARKVDPSVSRATIYRTLPVLVQTGLLRELHLGKDQVVYDPNYATHPNHNHLICTDCDKIIEFEDHCLDVRESILVKNMGFRPGNVQLRIEGSCEELKLTGICSKKLVKTAN